MASIQLEGVTKRFGPVVAIHRLTLHVQEGELLTLLGPSGCGKTTTLRLVAGFLIPEEGRIHFGTLDVTHLPPEHRNVGIVFQNYALFPHMTVAQNVAFGLEVRGLPNAEVRSRVGEILERVQLRGLEHRYPHQLSGGQQQRVALARALVINPQVLLLDEPLANLDAKLREEMRFYIRHLQREFGITTLYVTHDQAEAMVLADRIALLRDGILQQVAPPEEIYRRPQSRWVADFVGLCNFLPGRVLGREDGFLLVDTPIGVVRCSGTADAGRVLVCVRPESLRPDAGGTNRIVGVVRERTFLGNLLDLQVACPGGVVLRVQLTPTQDARPGEPLHLEFRPQDAWVVPEDG
jgi:putative spermidine/putrescine transport system ATP-binding protein